MSSILNADGSTLVNESYTAYGLRRNPTTWNGSASSIDLSVSAGVTRQGYTWQTALGNMGLNHMNGRVQDAITGVFLSPDPYISEPGNPQNYNRYSYVLNNPLSFTDPSGYKQKHRVRIVSGKRQSGKWHGTSEICTILTGTKDENGEADYITIQDGYYEPEDTSLFNEVRDFVSGLVNLSDSGTDNSSSGGDGKKPQELAQQTKQPTKQFVSPPRKPCPTAGAVDKFALGASGQTLIDGSVGVALDISKEMPKVASALRGAGGLFALGSIAHGISVGNYAEAVWGAFDVTAGVASIFPLADFLPGLILRCAWEWELLNLL